MLFIRDGQGRRQSGGYMEQFVDRELEIRTLGKEYAKKEASLVVVYGRRRVGKRRFSRSL